MDTVIIYLKEILEAKNFKLRNLTISVHNTVYSF
jgi:hypothetical protein